MSLKFGVVFTNFVLLVSSLVMLILGTIFQGFLNGNYNLFRGYVSAPTTITISFGGVLSLTAMLALISVHCRSHVLLTIYILVLALLVIIELAVGIAGFVVKSQVISLIADSLRSAEFKYTSDHLANSTWDAIQQNLKCCGFYHYDEWFHYLGNFSLPDSCCVFYRIDCGAVAIQTDNFFQISCNSAISKWAYGHEISFAIFFAFMLVLQFASLFCARGYVRVLNLFNIFENHNVIT